MDPIVGPVGPIEKGLHLHADGFNAVIPCHLVRFIYNQR